MTAELEQKLEQLAELEHRQWIEWSKNLVEKEPQISKERKERWSKLWVPYSELSEPMKDLDREWARQVLAIINGGDHHD